MNNILKKIRQRFNGYGVIVGVVIVMIVGTLLNGESFLTINNVSNVGRQATIRGLWHVAWRWSLYQVPLT